MAMREPRLAVGRATASDPPPVAQGSQRVDAVMQLPTVLRDLGLDPRITLAEGGLDPGVFDHPANEIPTASLGRVTLIAAARSGCANLGLLVGQRSGLVSLGLVGALARHSPDVGTALRQLSAHLHLRDGGAVAPLLVSDGVASFGYEIHQPYVEGGDQLCDGALAVEMNILRTLCGRGWRASEVHFAHRAPADLRPYRRFFEAPLHFDAERTALLFPATWLERRTAGADPIRFRELESRVDTLEQRASADLVAGLRRMLRLTLLAGGGSVDEVAERLSLHRRTLNRRLRSRGTSVHRLVEEVRSEIARQLVANTGMLLTEIAATLGYADASSFTHAFRRWTGSAPNAWRKAREATSRYDARSQHGAASRSTG